MNTKGLAGEVFRSLETKTDKKKSEYWIWNHQVDTDTTKENE